MGIALFWETRPFSLAVSVPFFFVCLSDVGCLEVKRLKLTVFLQLFDSASANGQVKGSATKESAIQEAGKMAMQMYFKSQAQQQGGLMGMASKFM